MELAKANWNELEYQNFILYLNSLQDIKYRNFHHNLLKRNINLIGIRTPILKNIAKSIYKGNYQEFLKLVKFNYYEETIIYAFIICNIKKLDNLLINYINIYKKNINNWATCDLFCSNLKIVKKNKEYFYKYINKNISNKKEYIKRMCFVLLTTYYIEEKYLNDIFNYSNKYCNSTYYVNMSIAWLISICYIKYPNHTIEYIKNNELDNFTYNKTLSKIFDSFRVSKNQKEELRKIKKQRI